MRVLLKVALGVVDVAKAVVYVLFTEGVINMQIGERRGGGTIGSHRVDASPTAALVSDGAVDALYLKCDRSKGVFSRFPEPLLRPTWQLLPLYLNLFGGRNLSLISPSS